MNYIEYFSEKFLRQVSESVDQSEIDKTVVIDSICRKYKILDYTIDYSGLVDTPNSISMSNKNLNSLPIKFGKVGGNFFCQKNYLKHLEGSPSYVGGLFNCGANILQTFRGCPEEVGGDFYCYDNRLTSLEWCPSSVGGDFYCHDNKIWNFDHFPRHIGGVFICDFNPIYHIWTLFNDYSKIELFNDYDIIRDDKVIIIDRINSFLDEIGKDTLSEGYLKLLSGAGYTLK